MKRSPFTAFALPLPSGDVGAGCCSSGHKKSIWMKSLLFLFFVLLGNLSLSADILNYAYDEENKTATVIAPVNGNKYEGDIVIPSSVTYNGETYSVTSIGEDAFRNSDGLTSVIIPNSVISIGNYAFADCSNLPSVTIPYGVTRIGRQTFRGCKNLISVTIPNSVRVIDYWAFGDCRSLASITIPNSVMTIDNSVFSGCSSLTSITIPNSVTSIGGQAFVGCSSLASIKVDDGNAYYNSQNDCNAIIETATNILIAGCQNTVIPDCVTHIGSDAFRGHTGLTSITIPNSVTTIEEYAFSGCSGLTTITIPEGVTSIGYAAFRDCESLTSAVLPESLTSLDGDAFARCYALEHINIPEGLTTIGEDAFDGTAWLNNLPDGLIYFGKICYRYKGKMPEGTEIVLKEGTVEIAGGAFSGCTGLVSVVIPESVTTIGGSAFAGCSGLTSINIPNGVTTIGEEAFSGCSSLASVTIPESVTDIGYFAFEGCYFAKDSFIDNSSSLWGWNSYGAVLYDEETSDGLMIVESVVVGCRPWATAVTIPEDVIGIGKSAFYKCSGLTSVTIPNSVTSIGDFAFYRCSGLTSVTIPNSVTSIGDFAFEDCSGLTSVTIPNSVTSIGDFAFCDCSGLTDVYCYAEDTPEVDEDAFLGIITDFVTLHVPAVSVDLYMNTPPWSGFGNIVAIDVVPDISVLDYSYDKENKTATVIASRDDKYAGDINIPSSVTYNGETYSVTGIGNEAFMFCSGLTSVTIPNSVTSIGNGAFYNCI